MITTAEQLLLLSIREDKTEADLREIARLYPEVGDDALMQAATWNKLVPVVAHGLMAACDEDRVSAVWSTAHAEALAKTQAFFGALERVAAVLDDHNIPAAVIENGGVARGGYQCAGCFVSGDFEMLAEKRNVPEIHRLLEAEGYQRLIRERPGFGATRSDEATGWDAFRRELPGGIVFWLNVQWRPVLRKWLPLGQEFSVPGLLARSQPAPGENTKVRLLSPEDAVLVCSIHTASHSFVIGPGLRLQLDVDRLTRHTKINWSIVVARAKERHIRRMVFMALDIPRRVFGAPVPEEALNELCPNREERERLRAMMPIEFLFNRGRAKFSLPGLLAFEARLCDDGALAGYLRRILLPSSAWMREAYGPSSALRLGFCYMHRLLVLATRKSP